MQTVETNMKKPPVLDSAEVVLSKDARGLLLDVEVALASLGDFDDDSIDWQESRVTMSAAFVGYMASLLLAYAVKYEGYDIHSKSDLHLLQVAESEGSNYLN